MMDGNDLVTETTRRGVISQAWTRISQVYQGTLDRWTPHTKFRWVGSFVLLLLFMLRIFTKQGWYIVTYALGIYHLNLFIAFLTPKIDPAMDFDGDDDNGPALPTRATEEFRPFIRRLPEFKFWLSVTKSTLIAFCCTFIDAFNIPVFWPILVMYFITLFCITMKRQIKRFSRHLNMSQLVSLNTVGEFIITSMSVKKMIIEPDILLCFWANHHLHASGCMKWLMWGEKKVVEHTNPNGSPTLIHMIKYRYLPFTHSKPKYKTVDSTVTVN